jgi:cytoskeleton protein RodZ
MPAQVAAAVLPPTPQGAPAIPAPAAVSLTQAAAAVPPPSAPAVVAAHPAIPAALQVPAPSPAAPAAANPPAVTVKAVANAWVQVRDAGGHVVFSRLMHAGESWTAPDQAGLTLTTGNAAGTVLVDGSLSSGPLGGQGVVRHGIALDPAALTSDKTAATSPE